MYVFSEKHVRLFPKTRTCFFRYGIMKGNDGKNRFDVLAREENQHAGNIMASNEPDSISHQSIR